MEDYILWGRLGSSLRLTLLWQHKLEILIIQALLRLKLITSHFLLFPIRKLIIRISEVHRDVWYAHTFFVEASFLSLMQLTLHHMVPL